MVALITAIAGLLCWLSTRYTWEMDWTWSGRHTVSEASRDVLDQMLDPIEITAYAREHVRLREAIKKIVARYQRVKPDIVLHFVNPDAVPDEVRNLGISVDGEMVLRYRDRSEHVKSDSEEEFTNALQRLVRSGERWLAFVEGHGERDPLGKANHDLGELGNQLKNRGFNIQPVNLATVDNIPENTQVLIIAGPRVNYLPGEVSMLIKYLERGGNLLWLADPGELYGLDGLADWLRITLKPGVVIDFAGRLLGIDNPTIVLVTPSLYPLHPATNGLAFTTIFPGAAALDTETNGDWRARPLLNSGDHTWLETGELEGEVGYDEDSDQLGPLDIGVTLERDIEREENGELFTVTQRIAVIADGDFLSNTYIGNSGNMELGIRIINWLGSDDEFISIPARIATDTHLELTPITAGIIGFGFLIILPLGLFGTGIALWWRRRKL